LRLRLEVGDRVPSAFEKMSAEDLSRFRDAVQSEPELARRLRGLDVAAFRAAVVALARERGLSISVDELIEAERQGRRAWLERGIDP
jgi:hypothetical protein